MKQRNNATLGEGIIYEHELRSLSIRINNYALENVVMEKVKPGEAVPILQYLQEMGFSQFCGANIEKGIFKGAIINENHVIIDKELDYFYKLFYSFHMKVTFIHELYKERFKTCDKFGDYLKSLYPIFCEIVQTHVDFPFVREETANHMANYTIAHFFSSYKI